MVLLLVIALSMSGCMAYWSHLQPINETVKDEASGQDCSPMFFGFGFGTNTIEKAMANGYPQPITRLRSVELHTNQVLVFGGTCLYVHGETGPKTVLLPDGSTKPSNLASPYYSP